jgi:hypothetical protein
MGSKSFSTVIFFGQQPRPEPQIRLMARYDWYGKRVVNGFDIMVPARAKM